MSETYVDSEMMERWRKATPRVQQMQKDEREIYALYAISRAFLERQEHALDCFLRSSAFALAREFLRTAGEKIILAVLHKDGCYAEYSLFSCGLMSIVISDNHSPNNDGMPDTHYHIESMGAEKFVRHIYFINGFDETIDLVEMIVSEIDAKMKTCVPEGDEVFPWDEGGQ